MNLPDLVECKRGASDSAITEFELKFGVSLPEEYKGWLSKFNGGRPRPSRFTYRRPKLEGEVPWYENTGRVSMLFHLDEDPSGSLELEYRFWNLTTRRVPAFAMPIGNTPTGDLICLSISGEGRGHVYFWDSTEEGDEDNIDAETGNNIYLISDTFAGFLNSLSQG